MAEAPRIAVIGAGIAGLACAARLAGAGASPVVFEKSRGLGGRLATRRIENGIAFDHGAQYATQRSPEFGAFLVEAKQLSHAAAWPSGPEGGFVGIPGMSALARPLAEGLEIRQPLEITGITRRESAWQLTAATGPAGAFDIVVTTAPAPQSARLLGAAAGAISGAEMAPCWALLLAFPLGAAPALEPQPDYQTWRGGALSWAARDRSKPGRGTAMETWTVHASPDWSVDNLELPREEAARRLVALFAETLGVDLPAPAYLQAHRWRYARVTTPLGHPFALADPQGLYAAGDWCIGARVEDAFLSGQSAAEAILAST